MNLNVWYFTSILKNYFCYILNKTSPWKIFLNANSFPSSNKWLQLLRFQVQIKFSVLGKKGHLSFAVCITLSLGFSSSKIKIRFLIRHIFHFSFHEAKVLNLRSQVRGYSLYCTSASYSILTACPGSWFLLLLHFIVLHLLLM